MGALPHRETAGHARPAGGQCAGPGLGHRDEAAHEDTRRAVSDRRGFRVLIPEKLYGRSREIESLFAAFERIV